MSNLHSFEQAGRVVIRCLFAEPLKAVAPQPHLEKDMAALSVLSSVLGFDAEAIVGAETSRHQVPADDVQSDMFAGFLRDLLAGMVPTVEKRFRPRVSALHGKRPTAAFMAGALLELAAILNLTDLPSCDEAVRLALDKANIFIVELGGPFSPSGASISAHLKDYERRLSRLVDDADEPPNVLRLSAPADAMEAFKKNHPDYDKNVFVMMSFSDQPSLAALWNELTTSLSRHKFKALRADQKTYGSSRQLWDNLVTYMHGCRYGIAVLDQETSNEFNPNVALEYGFMRALEKNVLLLKEKRFRNIRADILGTIWMEFDVTDLKTTVQAAIDQWVKDIM